MARTTRSLRTPALSAWLLALALLGAPSLAQATDARLADPYDSSNRASYLVIAPKAFERPLAPLIAWRSAHGQTARLVTLSSLGVKPGETIGAKKLRRYLSHAISRFKEKPRFVLLAADTDRIPCFKVADIPTDHPYACPRRSGDLELAVGRFPARTVEEIGAMVRKTIRYEKRRAGLWQRQLSVFAGVGGFKFDSLLEAGARKILSQSVPAPYQLDVTYASPSSPYFLPPQDIAQHLRERVEDGPLLVTFIGHGSSSGTQRARFAGRSYPMLDRKTAQAIERAQPSGMLVLACSTGAFQRRKDSIAEVLLKRPTGVVWFLGASEPSAPYGNGVLGHAVLQALLKADGSPTVGEGIARAKRQLLHSPLLRAIGKLSGALTGVSHTGDELKDHVLLYNLLGDPALRIPRPRGGIALRTPGGAPIAGGDLRVEGTGAAPGKPVTLTLERSRTADPAGLAPISAQDPDWPEKARKNHARSNDRTVTSATVTADAKGAFTATLSVPAGAAATLWLKAAAAGPKTLRVGAKRISVQPRPSAP